MLKAGAATGCKPGASVATIADETLGRESRDASAPGALGAWAPGATSSSRSGCAPAPGADAPGFSSFWGITVECRWLYFLYVAFIYAEYRLCLAF